MIIRSDDFDFRMPFEHYQEIHQRFIENGLVETAVIQVTQHGRMMNTEVKKPIIEYLRTAPNWDLQLHGWSHDVYSIKTKDEIYRDLAAALYHFDEWFGRKPSVWYPPWNEKTEAMELAAKSLGLIIDNEAVGIKDFVRQQKPVRAVYFHSWNRDEMQHFGDMIKLAKQL